VLTVVKGGGIGNLIENIDPAKLRFISEDHSIWWILAYFCMTTTVFTSLTGAPRYLAVRDGNNAKKAAFFTSALFVVGPLIWFIPPIAASYYFPDIASVLPSFKHPQDGAYVLMALNILPHGLAGLLIMVIFAATLSSMGGAVNQMAAIICMNVYKPLIKPKAGHKEMFIVAHIVTVIIGVSIVLMAMLFARKSDLPLFDLMLMLSSAIGVPIGFPFLLAYWVKKTPHFSAVLSVSVSSIFSILSKNFGFLDKPHRWMTEVFNSTGLVHLDPSVEWPLPFLVGGVIIISGSLFMLSSLLWPRVDQASKDKIAELYRKMSTPIDYEKENIPDEDNRQFFIVGIMAMIIGVGISLLALCPNTVVDRWAIISTGGFVIVVGFVLYRAGKKFIREHIKQIH
jgi:Na+/proline symporter